MITVLAVGAAAGLLAGLLGVGGGILFVPALLVMFRAQGMPEAVAMHAAVGTSLAAIVLTSLTSIRSHARRDNVDWPAFRGLLPGVAIGGLVGAAIAVATDATLLQQVFAVFLAIVALQLVFELRPAPHRNLPGPVGIGLAGATIGTLSALLGIGGGTLTAPYLVWCNRPILRAVGTAAAVGLPLALAGAIGFWWVGDYIVWPHALALGAVAMVTAPLGVRLAHRAPARWLRRAFAVVLLAVAVRLYPLG